MSKKPLSKRTLPLLMGLGLSILATKSSSHEGGELDRSPSVVQQMADAVNAEQPTSSGQTTDLGFFRNEVGEAIDLTLVDGVPYVERRDYRRYAGLVLDCFSRPMYAKVGTEYVLNRTVIAATAQTQQPPSSPPVTIFCQPAIVSLMYPPYDGGAALDKDSIDQYCIVDSAAQAGVRELSSNLESCRLSF